MGLIPMSSEKKLTQANFISNKELSGKIKSIEINYRLATIKILLNDGLLIFIRYNNYLEYSYSVIFSNSKLDRIRFDNFDDKWIVKTRPHHFHPKDDKNGYSSMMVGKPREDLPILFNLLKNPKIRKSYFRFNI